MIHLVIREPVVYQRTLCQALSDSYKGAFVAWFAEKFEPAVASPGEDFSRRFIPDVGYGQLYRELKSDAQAVVILGSWSSTIAHKTLLITSLLRIPIFIWTDHPHPRPRKRAFDFVRRAYLQLLSRRLAGFLACGQPTVLHLESLGIAPEKITNFPYWVEIPPSWSLPNGCREVNKPLRLVAIGRQVPVKAFEVAIEAVALANKDAGRRLATLELIGDGPERPNLEALIETMSLCDAVTFSGWIQNDQVWERLAEADALIITSHFEPYGVVVLEALANGRPVLASDQVVAALDRDDDKGAIFFHPAGDPKSLAQQIKNLAANRSRLETGAAAARAIAEEWPLTRAAAILQPVFDRVSQNRTERNTPESITTHDRLAKRAASTSDPS